MKVRITQDTLTKLNLAPESTAEEIIQNVWVILNNPAGTAPLARDIGLRSTYLHLPIDIAKARLAAEIYDKVRTLEPRAEVADITFTQDQETGRLTPVLEVEI